MVDRYFVPAGRAKTELTILRSRFISVADYTPTAEEAKSFISEIGKLYADASHHVYAYAIGFGNTVIYGMSNAGEPPGTAGKPTLAVVKGCGLGDITVVTVRYFGGTKLGTGGLVKAYTESAQIVLSKLGRTEKVEKRAIQIAVPYNLYEGVSRLVDEHEGRIEEKDFGTEVILKLNFPITNVPSFATALSELSSGRLAID